MTDYGKFDESLYDALKAFSPDAIVTALLGILS